MTDPWYSLDDGFPNGLGSEGGVVRLDEEHGLGARITLEEGGIVAPWSITCGIYGWMVHTRFFGSEEEARTAVALMKTKLLKILEMIPRRDDPGADEKIADVSSAIGAFVDEFP